MDGAKMVGVSTEAPQLDTTMFCHSVALWLQRLSPADGEATQGGLRINQACNEAPDGLQPQSLG